MNHHYEVKQTKEHRESSYHEGGFEFLVDWLNYEGRETWEPAANLLSAREILIDYLNAHEMVTGCTNRIGAEY